jgi:hypothetical protein
VYEQKDFDDFRINITYQLAINKEEIIQEPRTIMDSTRSYKTKREQSGSHIVKNTFQI